MTQETKIDYFEKGYEIGYENAMKSIKKSDREVNEAYKHFYGYDKESKHSFIQGYNNGQRAGKEALNRKTKGEKIMTFIDEYSPLRFKTLNETTLYSDTFDFTIYIHNTEINIDFIKSDDYSQTETDRFKLKNYPFSERHIFLNVHHNIDEEIIGKVLINIQDQIFSGENVLVIETKEKNKILVYNIDCFHKTSYHTFTNRRKKKYFSDDYRWDHKNFIKDVNSSIFDLGSLITAQYVQLPVELKVLILRNYHRCYHLDYNLPDL